MNIDRRMVLVPGPNDVGMLCDAEIALKGYPEII